MSGPLPRPPLLTISSPDAWTHAGARSVFFKLRVASGFVRPGGARSGVRLSALSLFLSGPRAPARAPRGCPSGAPGAAPGIPSGPLSGVLPPRSAPGSSAGWRAECGNSARSLSLSLSFSRPRARGPRPWQKPGGSPAGRGSLVGAACARASPPCLVARLSPGRRLAGGAGAGRLSEAPASPCHPPPLLLSFASSSPRPRPCPRSV